MNLRTFGLVTSSALALSVALLPSARPAHAIVLTNGPLSVDIRTDNGAIDTLTFNGVDFYGRGTHVSDWGIQNGSTTSTFRLNDTSGATGIPMATMSAPGQVTATGTYTAGGANVGIVRRYELVSGANALHITTTLQNNGTALTLRYFDTFDPDQGDQLGLGFETFNDVLIAGALRVAQARATNNLTVRIGGPAVTATVAAGAPFRIDSGSTLNSFFAFPFDGNDGLADNGIHLGYEVALANGASVVLEYRHSYGATAAAAATAMCGGADGDGDGVATFCDNCPAVSNSGQADADSDGFGDACDTCVGPGVDDSDGDGSCSTADNCPNVANPGQEDTCPDSQEGDACDFDADGDGHFNACDNCPNVANPGQEDTDGNGTGDACNSAEDSDGDEIADVFDNCPNHPNTGQEDTCFSSPGGDACDSDADGDGDFDACDNCPSVANPGQEETCFFSFEGDACDTDTDGDGDFNFCDNCPNVANPGQEDTCFNSFAGDACDTDTDGDGDFDSCDNCPSLANPGQEDADSDGIGNACNDFMDSDGDEWADYLDNCPDDPNPGQEDSDSNGVGNLCNDAEDSDGDEWADGLDNCPGDPNPGQENVNGNQLGDACEPQGQLDSTGCYTVHSTVAPPDGNEPTYSFIDISGTGDIGLASSHSVSGAIPIGFPFEYYGVSYSDVYISSNGFISLLPGQGEGCCGGQTIPDSFAPNAVIAGMWSHIHAPPGAVYYDTIGSSPTQQFIIQFQGVFNITTGSIDTWEIILHEGSNDIVVQYANANSTSFEGRGGIENEDGTEGFQWAGPGAATLINEAVRYAPDSDDPDGDGAWACTDNCPSVANPGQEDTCDASPEGDACDTDGDGDGAYGVCDNCPALANPGQEDTDGSGIGDACNDAIDADGDEFEDATDNCPDVPNPGISNVGAGALSQLLNGLEYDNAALSALIPNRFDFSEGQTGNFIIDGGADMYDGGNFLNTNLATTIPYTNGVITPSTYFGGGSSYFTAKYAGVFVMAATNLNITNFFITGNNGADGGGSVDATVLTTSAPGGPYKLFIKRVFNAFGDPSINHIIIVPGTGAGVTYLYASNTDNGYHSIDGLGSVSSIFYILVARQNGLRLDDADAISIAKEFLSHLGQADADGDGYGDACDACFGIGTDDDDSDGYCNMADNCPLVPNPGQEETCPGSPEGDACDVDSDGDGFDDPCDTCIGPGPDDVDSDGHCSLADNCPDDSNIGQEDGDSDSVGDLCDNCLMTVNPGQDDTDSDGTGDACNDGEDGDGDEWADGLDNCPITPNPGQENFDGDADGDLCDLEHFTGYKAHAARHEVGGNLVNHRLPRPWVITVNDIQLNDADADDPENFEVRNVTGVFNPTQKNLQAAPDLNGVSYLRYRMRRGRESVAAAVGGVFPKPPKHTSRVWHLNNQFGSINVESRKVSSLLLPASVHAAFTPAPPQGDPTHFVCYQVKATADITDQTPERQPNSGIGKFREGMQAFFVDRFHDCFVNHNGFLSFPGTSAAGKCLLDFMEVKELCNPMSKTAVQAPRKTTATITPSTATTPRSLLCYRPRLATKFTTAGTALMAGLSLGTDLPKQRAHSQRVVRYGTPIHTFPGNLFPQPYLMDTVKTDLVCVPTDVTSVSPVP